MTTIAPELLHTIWPDGARAIADILGHQNLRAVGGSVRDVLLHKNVRDVDLATVFAPAETMEKLMSAGVQVVPTGVEYGTVTAVVNGVNFEITTLREDVETDGRRAVVKYTNDWAVDAQRRDFTINAFYLDADGHLFDGSGEGEADLAAKRLRFIGDAETRIREDYLRILRLFRFTAQLEGFRPDEAALAASAALKDGLRHLSGERVTMEWDRLLNGPQTPLALELLEKSGINTVYAFRSDAAGRLDRLPQGMGSLALRYALAFEDAVKAQPFVFSRKMAGHIDTLLRLRDSDMGWEECAYRHDTIMAEDYFIWRCIISNGDGIIDPVTIESIRHYDVPASPIRSIDYIKQGFSGEALGKKLKEETEAWVRRYFIRKS